MPMAKRPRRNNRRRTPSRRACVAALAAAAAAATLPAHAQIDWSKIDIWKPYQREDLGFSVEMPGEPDLEEEDDPYSKSISASFLFVGMMLSVDHIVYKQDVPIDKLSKHLRLGPPSLKSRITREAPFTVDGFPAIEIVKELENGFVFITRAVAIGNRVITVSVIGGPDIAANPSALRFLNSFKLLPLVRSE